MYFNKALVNHYVKKACFVAVFRQLSANNEQNILLVSVADSAILGNLRTLILYTDILKIRKLFK